MKTNFIRLTAAALLLCAALPSSARPKHGSDRPWKIDGDGGIGIEFGYIHTTYYEKELLTEGSNKEKYPLDGFQIGVNYDLPIIRKTLYFEPGLYYVYGNSYSSMQKEEFAGARLSRSHSDHSLNIPLKFKYTYDFTRTVKITADLGPTLSFGLANNYKFTTKIGEESFYYKYNAYTGKPKTNIDDPIQSGIIANMIPKSSYRIFDVLVGAGVGVELWNMLGFRLSYEYGCVNRASKANRDFFKIHKDLLNLSVSVRF